MIINQIFLKTVKDPVRGGKRLIIEIPKGTLKVPGIILTFSRFFF